MTRYCVCGKVYCATEVEVRALRVRIVEEFNDPYEVRFYQCSAHGWHWTRRLTPPGTPKPAKVVFQPETRQCGGCAAEFTAMMPDHTYCSKTCKRRAKKSC